MKDEGPKRCPHRNGELVELMIATHVRLVQSGKVEVEGVNEIEDITGYVFKCFDCRKTFEYSNPLKAPKWFQGIYAQLLDREE